MDDLFKRKKKGKLMRSCSLLLSAVMVLNTLSFDGTTVFASEEQETESYGTEASEEGSGAKIPETDVEEIIEKETPKEERTIEGTTIEWREEEKKTQEETTEEIISEEEIQKENDNSNETGAEETTEEKQDNVEELIAASPEHVTRDNAEEVSYLDCDADGKKWGTKTCTAYTEISSDTTAWSNGWYVVSGAVTISSRVTVTGNVCLILTDGCTLEVTKGITVNSGNGLKIYAQSAGEGVGSLKVTAPDQEYAGIGGDPEKVGGEITINGGKVTANGGKSGAGIGGGWWGAGGKITINGGKVTAGGGENGAGIGGGSSKAGGEITINGGEVAASGGKYGAGIGGGWSETGGKITINGGKVTSGGGRFGAGIGGGYSGAGGEITINGGEVTAGSGVEGAGIGGGRSGAGGTITITGGTITATGKDGGADIGGGNYKVSEGTVFISGATVNGQRYYAVSFVVPGMPEVKAPPVQGILEGGKVTDPGIEISGYTILGWFENEAYTDPFDFSTETITKDLTLYAKWEVCKDFIAEVTIDGESREYTTIGTAWAALSGKTGTMKVLKDVTTTNTLTVGSGMNVTVEMADGATFTNTTSDCFQIKGGTLTLTGGTVVEEASGKSVVYAASGTLRITGGAYRSTQGNGLWIDKAAAVKLSGGTISASNTALRYGSRKLKEMLDTEGNQCVIFCDDADNHVTDILEMEQSTKGKTYTVKGNTSHNYEWVNKGATQHRQRCSNCGQEGDYGEHTFQNGVCTLCQAPCGIQVTTGGETILYESLEEAWAALDGKTGTLKLMQNMTTTDTLTVSSGMDVTVEMAEGVTLTNTSSDCFQINGGTLTLTGGTVVGEASGKSVVYATSGTLRITGGTYRSTKGNGLWIDKDAKVRLSGGTISAKFIVLRYEAPHKLKEMLDTKEDQCVAFYKNNKVTRIILEEQESVRDTEYTVKQNTAHKYEWKDRGTQHCQYCSDCGKEKDFGEHTFENDACTVCKTKAAVKVKAREGGTECYASIEAAWKAVQGRTATMTILRDCLTDNSLEITDEKTDVTVEKMEGIIAEVRSSRDLFIVRSGKLTINSGTFLIRTRGMTGIDITGGTVVMNGGKIEIFYSGSNGIRIHGSGTLNLCGGELEAINADQSGIALCVDGGTVRMTGGTLTSDGLNKALRVSGGKSVVSLLEKEYNFYKDGTPLTDKLDESELGSGTYTVEKCTHEYQLVHTKGTTVHEQKCSLCRFVKGEPEPCSYEWSVGSNKAVCAVCNSCLTVSVDETDGLVYDGTEKKPSVSVMLDDGSTLTEGYTVTYAGNINAGDNTASITVEGNAFEGTYTQNFSIGKAEGTLTVPYTSFEKTFGDKAFSLKECSTNGDGQISYVSDREDVASVSADGTVQVKGAGTANITVSLAEGENYTGAEGKDIIITVKKAAPKVTAPTVADRVYNPVRSLADGDLSGGSAEGVDGQSLNGVWSWKSASLIPSVGSSSYEAVFTPEDAVNYKTATVTIPVTVTKAMPYIAALPAASAITYGDALDASILSGGTVRYGNGAGEAGSEAGSSEPVKGTFAWKKPSAKPTVSDSGKTEYAVVFTPEDAVNYAPVEAAVTLTVDKAQNAPNMPGSTMDVSNSLEKVGDVPLPDGWEWQKPDQDTALEVGKTVNAAAVYTGADKGNYEKETVTVAITRSDCDHVAGDILYTGADEMAPTCTKDGLGHKECSKCGAVVESGIVVPASGHDYTSEVTKEPTVDAEGERTYTCSKCGNTYTEAIPKISCAHESGDDILYTGTGEKAPTCTKDGLGHKECTKCGAVVETGIVVKALGHEYTSEVTKKPTVDAEGEKTYTCSRCGNTYTEAIPKITCAHESGDDILYTGTGEKAPTCTEDGLGHKECSKCGAVVESGIVVKALGHDYNEGEVTKEPTVDAEGERTYTCSRCGNTYTEAIPKITCAHESGDDILYTGTGEKAPTCTEGGLGHKECTKCGAVVETGIVVKALGHDYTGEVTKEPTIDAEGERTYTCSRCGNTYIEAIPKITCDHESGDDILYTGDGEKAPTCKEDGLGHKECSKCGSVVETGIVVKALGHDYNEGEVTKEPTVDAEGEKTYTCSRCGDAYIEPIPREIPEGLWISGLEQSIAYTGSAIIPEGIRVYHGSTLLREKAEYTISYKNNMNAGIAQVIVTGKGSYKGKVTAEFTIEAVDLSVDTNIAAFAATAAETGKNLKPAVTVTWNGKKLKEKKDYTLSYDANIKAASTEGYDVMISGVGNYKGAIVRKFRVAPKGTPLLNSAKVTGLAKSYQYPSGEAQGNADVKPEGLEADLGNLVVKIGKTTLTKGTDYTVRIEKADAVGTGTIVLEPTQTGAYAGEKRISFNIAGTDLKKGSITGLEKTYPYTGETVKPEIRVYSGKKETGTQIPSDAYTVRYSSCVNPGKATVTVTGIPEKGYSGSISAAYAIGKYDISVGKTDSSITVKMPEDIKYAKGGAKPQPVITHTNNGTVRTLREGVDYTLKYSNNTSANGKNKPILKITGIGNYCGTVTEQYVIAAQDLSSLTITAADRAYNSKKKGSYYYSAAKVYDLDGKLLKQKTDYTVQYFDAFTGQEVGKNDAVPNGAQIRVTVTAAENSSYTGTLSTIYNVRDAKDVRDIAKAKSDKIAPQQYTGSEIKPEVNLYMQTGKTKNYLTAEDYEIIGYYNNVQKGTATVLIRGRNAYSGAKSITFKITAADNQSIWSGIFL